MENILRRKSKILNRVDIINNGNNMLSTEQMQQLFKIQSTAVTSGKQYVSPVICMACGNGPTNCQNQW